MKGCLAPLTTMLADAAPWYLPLVVVSVSTWLLAPSLEARWTTNPWARRAYRSLPLLLVGGLLAVRAVAVLFVDMKHNEVRLHLDAGAALADRIRLLFAGDGALEGSVLALLMFGCFVQHLPSLRGASDETKAFVQRRMMVHSAAWSLVVMLLTFSSEMHSALLDPPTSPTLSLPSWTSFGGAVLVTLLLMMAGEVLISSSHLIQNRETSLLHRRALVKTYVVGSVVWWGMLGIDVYTEAWWARPDHLAANHMALIVLVYATLMTLVHAPLTATEGRFSHHPRQSRTLGLSVVVVWVTLIVVTWDMAEHVIAPKEAWVAFATGWRLATSVVLAGGLLMLLPLVGFDSAHRPEAWWFRWGLMGGSVVGPLLTPTAWLLVPGALIGAGAMLILPWLAEPTPLPRFNRLVVWVVWLSGTAAMLIVESGRTTLLFALATLVAFNFLHRWSHRWRSRQAGA